MTFHVPHHLRIRTGRAASTDAHGNNGAFWVPNLRVKGDRVRTHVPLRVIASEGFGWEHVSVSLPERCPIWQEMTYIKGIFWDPEDAVMQLHPPASTYVNNHPFCLHLWRPIEILIPLPPVEFVGVPELNHEQVRALLGMPA